MPLPARDGFRMPAEWEPHAGAWMLWPERPDNWRDEARPAQRAYAAVAAAIAKGEPVTMCVSAGQFATARAMMARRGVEWTEADTEFFLGVYEATAGERHALVRDSERRLRRAL